MKFGFSDLPTAMCYRLKLAACSTPVRWEIWESTDEVKIQTVPGPEQGSECGAYSLWCGGLQVYVLAVQQSLALLSILPVPSVRSTDRTEFLNRTNCAAAATPTARYGARRAAATGRSWSAMGDRRQHWRFGPVLHPCWLAGRSAGRLGSWLGQRRQSQSLSFVR